MTHPPSPIWHPFTQHALADKELHIERAQGSLLYTKDGRAIIDAISSWWVNVHGHCHPAIVTAVQEQAAKLDQIIFAGFTHEPAETLAKELLSLVPPDLKYVFLSDSGSTAVEVALKMAIGYFTHKGKPRHKIIALQYGYHGDTFGAMSVSGSSVFTDPYASFLFDVEHLPFPAKGREAKTIEAFKDLLEEEGNDIAALILEPLIQGASGMRMYPATVLKELGDLCKQYGVLLIADEVMTGWGRTGTRFACEQADIVPDILCLSKGLTGGFLPLGATLCKAAIYDAFYVKDKAKTFWHSSSFTGNPLSCAAAVASIKLWKEDNVEAKVNTLCEWQKNHLAAIANDPLISNPRQCGTITAFEICHKDKNYLSSVAAQLYAFFLTRNILLRPLGNTIYVLPPYCITQDELRAVYGAISEALDAFRTGALKPAA
jgi:adenosylmethionine---8-amino-7-oxononanoate aminotransferase